MDPQDVGDGVDDRMTVEEVEIFPAIAEDEFRTKMEEIDRFLQSREKGIT
jgi:translation initiation factor IF-3